MNEFLKKYRFPIIIAATLLLLLLVILQNRSQQIDSRFQSLILTIAYPAEVVGHTVSTTLKGWWESYVWLLEVQEENVLLREQVGQLQEELNRVRESAIQFERLRNQLEFASQNPSGKLFAEIISESTDGLYQIRLINRGSHHGVQRNFAVILQEGLVGRIQAVSPAQSQVQLVIDQRSRVPALIQRTRTRGLVFGMHSGLELRQVSRRAEIEIGDRVISSGLGRMFPKGTLIGRVIAVRQEPHELFQSAILEPAVDFDRLEEVFVLLKQTESGMRPLFTE
jgi:rod shape-determining protein MreC